MKILLSINIFLFFFIFPEISIGQCEVFATFKKAAALYCENKIDSSIMIFDKIVEDNNNTGGTNKLAAFKLAEIYDENGETSKAIYYYNYTLTALDTVGICFSEFTCQLFNTKRINPFSIKFETCKRLSEIYLKKNEYQKALDILKIGDERAVRLGADCANGVIMSLTELSPYFVNVYLQMGDTSAAINRLLDYILAYEGSSSRKAIDLLKDILNRRYTKAQIKKEIEMSIANLKMVKYKDSYGDDEFKLEFMLFNHKPEYIPYPVDNSKRKTQKYFKDHEYLKQLYQ